MDDWSKDLRYGFRMFLRTPGWTLVIILSLAIGIGANSGIFSLAKAVLLNPLPFQDPEKLVIVWEDATAYGFPENTPAPANYLDWNAQNHVFQSMAAVAEQDFNLTGSGEPLRLNAYSVTQNFFPLLGVQPVAGRIFLPEEDRPNANAVAVLSYGLWQRRFGGSPTLIGKEILLNSARYTVVGIMPKNFQFMNPEIELWVPMKFTPENRQNRSGHYLQVIGRLKKDVSLEKARAEMQTIMKQIASQYPDEAGQLGISVVPLREQLVGDRRTQVILLSIAVGFVLLIACGNIANLLLSAGISRKKEIALRAALGAGRARLVRQLLMENMILSGAGGILALVFGRFSFDFLTKLIPDGMSQSIHLKMDSSVLLFTLFISVLTGLLFSLAPAVQIARMNLNDVIKSGGVRSGIGHGRGVRSFLVIAETSLAVVLLIGSALLIQTIYRLQTQQVGFRAENVLRIETRLPKSKYDTNQKRVEFYHSVLERVQNLNGIISAGYSTAVPLDWKGGTSGYLWENRPLRKNEVLDANHREVTSRLLQTLGVPLVEGQYFSGKETPDSLRVAIINEAMARTYSQNESVLGKRFQISPDVPWFTVVGIVKSIRNMGIQTEPKAEMYFPVEQADYGFSFYAPKELLIRTTTNPTKLVSDVRSIIRAIDPDQPLSHIMSLQFVLDREIAGRRMTMILLAIFAGMALLLASIGIYGVLSYFVNQQIPEIGVRLALGAQPISILILILRRGLGLTIVGIGIGVAGALALTGIVQSLLYEVSPKDPATFTLVVSLLLIAALAACLLPGRKAMKIDPLAALRTE